MQPSPKKTEVGVLIGRFQVPTLHKGQRQTIESVFERHRKVIILVGVSAVKVSRRDPLDFPTRELMIKRAYPKAIVQPLRDMADDHAWSKGVDYAIGSAIGDSSVTLYGSRDSFIPSYHGNYPTVELPASLDLTGTAAREAASLEVRAEVGYRVGVIYGAWNRYPISYQCVDAVIWRRTEAGRVEFLLGRKRSDGGLWRFPGGFVSPEDADMEQAALREATEETGQLSFQRPVYLFSIRVDDWRYRKERDKIMTAVFSIEYQFGGAQAKDDLDEVQWFQREEVDARLFVIEHRSIWEKASAFFQPGRLFPA